MPDGYVTDAAYVAEYAADHSPAAMNWGAAFCGVAPRPLDQGFTWCDFGCGHGLTTAILAAAYPQGQFYGVDVQETQVGNGRALAEAGFLGNATFLKMDFKALRPDTLPPLDFAVLHGVLSQVDGETRQAVIAHAAQSLKPGGLMLATYNALPGWAAIQPLRDLLFSVTAEHEGNALARARAAQDWLRGMRRADVKFFRDNPAIGAAVDGLLDQDPRHMAHEYFLGLQTPFHFAQISNEMQAHGLSFAGRTEFALNLVDLAVPSTVQPALRRCKSRAELEAKRDFIRNETVRRDLYVKGSAFGSEAAWEAAQRALVVGLETRSDLLERQVSFGDLSMTYTGTPFDEVLAALDEGACTVADLPQRGPLKGQPPMLVLDAVRLLLAGGLIRPFATPTEPPGAGTVDPSGAFMMTHPLNRAMAGRLGFSAPRVPLVSPGLGGGLMMSNMESLLLLGLCDVGRAKAPEWAAQVLRKAASEVVVGTGALSETETLALFRRSLDALISDKLEKLVELGVVMPVET